MLHAGSTLRTRACRGFTGLPQRRGFFHLISLQISATGGKNPTGRGCVGPFQRSSWPAEGRDGWDIGFTSALLQRYTEPGSDDRLHPREAKAAPP